MRMRMDRLIALKTLNKPRTAIETLERIILSEFESEFDGKTKNKRNNFAREKKQKK